MVSVIVPIYKVEPYLVRCVDSILVQTYTDFELILVDDGSPDRCGMICDEYAQKDARVRVVHKKNGGVSDARNAGLQIANGEYIAFCDGDDDWEPCLLERAAASAETEQADCVVFNAKWIRKDSLETSQFQPGSYALNSEQDRFDYFTQYFFRYSHGYEVAFRLFRASAIHDNHLQFCTSCNNYAEDMGFCAVFSLYASKIVVIPDALYRYEIRDDSMMTGSNQLRFHELNEVAAYFSRFYEQVFSKKPYSEWGSIFYLHFMLNQMKRFIMRQEFRSFPLELEKIQNKQFMRENLKQLVKLRPVLESLFGKTATKEILLYCRYAMNQNWLAFRAEKKLLGL